MERLFRRCSDFTVCSWNVRSLVENSGDIRICRKQCLDGNRSYDSVDRKFDLLVGELQRYKVSVGGIQETKWFGADVWPAANGYTLLHSGRPAPSSNDAVARREGVGLALDARATAAWRMVGEVWKPVSSRVIMARLKWVWCQRRSNVSFVTIVCVYAPTAKAPPAIRSQFLEQLQDTLDDVPLGDTLVMLGDFNARVGMFDPADGLWHKTIGRYGLVERNHAGEELLQFCELNQLTVLNICFQKKPIHLGTWVHPATKPCHMIDFVVMRTSQRKCALFGCASNARC